VFCIERITTNLKGGVVRGRRGTREVCWGLSSLGPDEADPARLLELASGHWAIENKVHHVRDRTFDEDRSQVRKRNAPQATASLRNTAISLLRLAGISGETSIAAALRHCGRKVRSTLRLIGIA